MSYRNDQFFRFNDNRPPTTGDNPPFLYPGKNRHRMDVIRGNQIVKRGFIKSLLSESSVFENLLGANSGVDSKYFGKRMFFQFNPQLITQNVSQSSGSSLPFLQDPGQLTQPMMGDTNFSFDIMLDRQMEMNRGYSYGDDRNQSDGSVDSVKDPADIGVFADLKVLYQIIGQGLSSDQIKLYESLLSRSSAQSTQDSETSADAATSVSTPVVTDAASAFTDLNINAGNSAFLAPLPIRVVFSSLFMVDGFVSSTQVMFTKFNANMVPVQARVAISMQAIYIGFAREKTVLSEALSNADIYEPPVGPSTPSGNNPVTVGDSQDAALLVKFEKEVLNTFRVGLYGDESKRPPWGDTLDESIAFGSGSYDPLARITEDLLGSEQFGVLCGFSDAPPNEKQDIVYNHYLGNNKMTLSYQFTMNIFRDGIENSDEDPKVKMMVLEAGPFTASTAEEYKKIRRLTIHNVKSSGLVKLNYPIDNGRPGAKLFMSDDNFQKFVSTNKKLSVEIDFRMTITMGSSSGNTERVYSPRTFVRRVKIEKSFADFRLPILNPLSTTPRAGIRTGENDY